MSVRLAGLAGVRAARLKQNLMKLVWP